MKFIVAVLAVVLLPLIALAQVTLPTEPDAIAAAIISAISGGNWTMVFVLGLVGVIWVVRKFGSKLIPFLGTSEGGALLALVTGVILYIIAVKYAGQPITFNTLILAVTTAWAASGSWTVMRKILALIPWPWLQALVGAEPKPTT